MMSLIEIRALTGAAVFVLIFMASFAIADDNVRDVQQILNNLGYDAGPVDGTWGRRTNNALGQYAEENALNFEGSLSEDIHKTLVNAHPGMATSRSHLEQALGGPVPVLFPTDNQDCPSFAFNGTKPLSYEQTLNRNVHGEDRIGGFIDSVGNAISSHIGNKARNSSFYKDGITDKRYQRYAVKLVEAADKQAFTRLDFAGKGPNPAHWVSALLHNLALYINYADRENLLEPAQRKKLIDWGNRLYDTSHRVSGPGAGRAIKSVRWPDTAAMQTLSYISWGLAANNLDALDEGVTDWLKLHRLIRNDGGMKTFLNGGKWQNVGGKGNNDFYYDNTLGFMVIAANLARSVGINLFDQVSDGATIHDAVRWKVLYSTDWQSLPGMKREPLYDNHNGRRRYFQPHSFGGNWGWTEAYLQAFPEIPISEEIRAANRKSVSTRFYRSTTMGPMSCLFGAHR